MAQEYNLDTELALLTHIEGQLNRADTKAQFTLTIDAILLASTSLLQSGTALRIFDASSPLVARIAAVLSIVMFITLFISTLYALAAVIPRLAPPQSGPVNVFFFGSILGRSEKDFIATYDEQTPHFKAMILSEIYAASRIAQRKFGLVRRSYQFIAVSLGLWTLAQLLLLFAK